MNCSLFLVGAGLALPFTLASTARAGSLAADATIIVTADKAARGIANAPSTRASIDALRIAETVNALTVEDTLKYLPSLLVRKRNIGDTQSPLATRTSGVGSSARSLVYADGALLSALIGNNNSNASPRWGLVSPQEIARIDVLYGPFAAAYPGNSIGAVVNITTRLPETLEGTVSAATSLQTFRQYDTDRDLPAWQIGATLGDRFGPLSFFLSANRTQSKSQPLAYVTATRPALPGAAGAPTTGGFDDVNRANVPIRILGAGGFEDQLQHNLKLKLALDLSRTVRLAYVGGLFLNNTGATAETYLRSAAGVPVYSGSLNIAGYPYSVAASAFSNNIYSLDQRHWSHSLSATGAGGQFEWQVIGTLFDFARDEQRLPATALPGASGGGGGTVTRLDGTGWNTFDAKALWRPEGLTGHTISFGVHRDEFKLESQRFVTTDWLRGTDGARNLASKGKTRTTALWVQDAWQIAAPLVLTVGGRQEWWKAFDGYNYSAAPALGVVQPELDAARFSPKASLAWAIADAWHITGSFGRAYRFPTVTELYQAITTGPTITVPDPRLRPENATSTELAAEHRDDNGYVRLSFFTESIRDALVSQTAPLVPGSSTLFNYVQNIGRVRTHGLELAFEEQKLGADWFDLGGSATFVDPRIVENATFPAAVGKNVPQLPVRRATLVATFRPAETVALTAAARYSSRSFATIDNSDPVSHTYQGFDGFFVVDLRASWRINRHVSGAIGVNNVNNDRYFLFHPFPQRSFFAELTAKL